MKFEILITIITLSSTLLGANAYSGSYLDSLRKTAPIVDSAREITKTDVTAAVPSPAGAASSDVASKLVGGFPASTSLVDAGFDGSNAMSEADLEVINDPIFVKVRREERPRDSTDSRRGLLPTFPLENEVDYY
jgi:hypothetical protein